MCQFIHIFLLLIVCSTSVKTKDDDSKLLSFVQLFRHGARTPVMFFKDDPYKNVSYWGGLGRGQLTKGIRKCWKKYKPDDLKLPVLAALKVASRNGYEKRMPQERSSK
ncbi:unnamed protein product [Acanthoscelides obtectus]|uniref:Uncharacterized protein n=1 Tax=Acanthoscelides obtectus TaxID=200917 RepID=A0A9P0P492_ACAOB|nr:unnamed protein product [Acanthoscelides obtectus]CAK1622991.1 hypothetical protein AOBTE_LOCUS1762 [Acanthoscelides obtectus]